MSETQMNYWISLFLGLLTVMMVGLVIGTFFSMADHVKIINTTELYKQCQAAGGTLVNTVCYGEIIELKMQ